LRQLVLLIALPMLAGASLASATPQTARAAPQGLTAYRPQNGTGYAPFARTPVPDAVEEHPELGPGIRVNGAGEVDPVAEDDLVEVVVGRALRGTPLVVERSGPELALWTTRDKQPGTALAFTGDVTAPLVFGGAAELKLWAEWLGPAGALGALVLRAPEPDVVIDRLVFHSFTGLVVALGGEDQVPAAPVDSNHGTYLVATDLYERGWDVLMRDEDQVSANGSGLVYTEVVNAIQHRAVGSLAIFGYSHGAGSTYDLAERLDTFRGSIGTFALDFTSYVDGVENDSDIDLDKELRRPLTSGYHANHWQRGSFADFFLDGGPVPTSNPPPSGLDVETVVWGFGATHFLVDDYDEVRDFMLQNLAPRVNR
jgi:hypothetical protein